MTVIEGKLSRRSDGSWSVSDFIISDGTFLSLNLQGNWVQGLMNHDGRNYVFCAYGRILYPKAGYEARLVFKEKVI